MNHDANVHWNFTAVATATAGTTGSAGVASELARSSLWNNGRRKAGPTLE